MLDRSHPIADAVGVKDRRPIPFALGLLGLVSGITSLVTDTPALGLVAGLCAIAAVLAPFITSDALAPTEATEQVPIPVPVAAVGVSSVLAPAAASTIGPADAGLLDPVTGLYSEDFFRVAVETRVLAARRHLRPVAVVLFDVIDGLGPGANRQANAEQVAHAIKQTLREADTACRLRDGRYGFVLEDTPEDGAIWTVERLRRKLSEFAPDQTRWAGIACYPAHAFSADEVMAKAEVAFNAAREWAQDRIEVAVTE
jgi:GGDEF domain-containing protein